MMTTADNSSSNAADSADNNNNVSTTNLNIHVNSTDDNSHDYLSFNMHLVLNYMNNQLIYYYIFNTISAVKQTHFQQLMKQCKTFLELLEWNNASDKNNKFSTSEKNSTILINSDFDCSALLSDHKSIKINSSDILKLTYNSMIAQYNNWLVDVKTDFDRDSARFSISYQKIILISITLDKQLKIMFNSVT